MGGFCSVLEHVTQQLLHGGVADGPVEEEELDPLGADEAQRGEQQQQLPEPERATGHHTGLTNTCVGNK